MPERSADPSLRDLPQTWLNGRPLLRGNRIFSWVFTRIRSFAQSAVKERLKQSSVSLITKSLESSIGKLNRSTAAMHLRFHSGIFPSKKSTNIFRSSGKKGLRPRQISQKGGEFLLQGVSLSGVSGGKSNASQLVDTTHVWHKYPGRPKEVG